MSDRLKERLSDDSAGGEDVFDIALSFAGAERPYARTIARILADNDLRVFLDELYASALWGTNLVETLSDIYENKARYCVILVSREYCERVYTNLERRSALDRAIQSPTAYILPLLVDDSWIQGLPKSTAYLDLRQQSILAVCEAVYRKLRDELPADGLGIPEDIDWSVLDLGAPTAAEKKRYALLSAVRRCFDRYRQALLNDDGWQAVKLVSQSTLDFYERFRELALYGRAKEVRELSFMGQLLVLLCRHRLTAEQLDAMTGADLFVLAIESGWTGKSDLSAIRIRRVKQARPDLAFAEFVAGNQSLGFRIRFVKERGAWRLDMLSLVEIAEMAFQARLDLEGTKADDFLEAAVASLTGRALTKKSWEPLVSRKA